MLVVVTTASLPSGHVLEMVLVAVVAVGVGGGSHCNNACVTEMLGKSDVGSLSNGGSSICLVG